MLPIDTGKSLYQKLERECVDLFKSTWPLIRNRQAPRNTQIGMGDGTSHRLRDVDRIDEIDLDKTYLGRELIDILRARTFAPYRGAYFTDGDRKVYLRLDLSYENNLDGDDKQ